MKPKTQTECEACELYREAWLETADELANANLTIKSAEKQLQLLLEIINERELLCAAKSALDSLKNRVPNKKRGRDA